MNKNKLSLSGTLIGVDFTKKGQFTNEDGDVIKYDDSIKLKLNIPVSIVKQDISTSTVRQVTLKLPMADSIEEDVARYNKDIGKEITAELIPTDNQTFSVSGSSLKVSSPTPTTTSTRS